MSNEQDRKQGLTYRDAGVDIDAQDRALDRIKEHLASTKTAGVLSELGSFGGLFRVPGDVDDAVLVASADGVGTKLMIAWKTDRHDTVGEDLVNHCVNDILVMGARPLFFLDYFAVGKLDPLVAEQVVAGVARGCRGNGCALLGGETAEMPDMYREGEYDLAGTIVGVVSKSKILDGSQVAEGDLLVGLVSTGLHTNGYTLARKIAFERMGLEAGDELPGVGKSVGEALLAVHRSYFKVLERPLENGWIHALSHITGGGLTDNLPRVLPKTLRAEIDLESWEIPPLFRVLQREGGVPWDDMLRTFNNGIGMVAVVPASSHAEFTAHLEGSGEKPVLIGRIVSGDGKVHYKGSLE